MKLVLGLVGLSSKETRQKKNSPHTIKSFFFFTVLEGHLGYNLYRS